MRRLGLSLVLVLAILLGLVWVEARAIGERVAPPRPEVAEQFLANVTVRQAESGAFFSYDAEMWYDAAHSRMKYGLTVYFSGYPLTVAEYLLKDEGYMVSNGVCRNASQDFAPLFSWLPGSEYVGQAVIDGKETEEWQLQVPDITITLYAIGNVPVLFLEQTQFMNFSIDFRNFTAVDSIPDSIFVPPKTCFGTGVICDNGRVDTLELYRFHPVDDWVWSNRNFADAIGDVFFVCFAGHGKDQLISQLTIRLNSSWGQYALCNENQCDGLNTFNVGREATLGLGVDLGGQCTPNSVLGSWYSFPIAGECKDNSSMVNCTWQVSKTIKTISLDCLKNLSLLEACKKDNTFPFPTATLIFNNAFKYDDPSQGGCPSVNQSTISSASFGSSQFFKSKQDVPFWKQPSDPYSFQRVLQILNQLTTQLHFADSRSKTFSLPKAKQQIQLN